MLSKSASRSSKALRSAVSDDKLSEGGEKPWNGKREENGGRTVHLYPNLYVIFRWMGGTGSLLAVRLDKNKREEGSREKCRANSILLRRCLSERYHIRDRESNRMQESTKEWSHKCMAKLIINEDGVCKKKREK